MKPIQTLILALILIFFASSTLQAQSGSGRNYKVVTERNAEYPGGNEALYRFFYQKMNYPEAAAEAKVKGQINMSFEVLPDSTVANVQALNDLGYGTKEEAIRLVKMLKFAPALQNGKPIKQSMMLPVIF